MIENSIGIFSRVKQRESIVQFSLRWNLRMTRGFSLLCGGSSSVACNWQASLAAIDTSFLREGYTRACSCIYTYNSSNHPPLRLQVYKHAHIFVHRRSQLFCEPWCACPQAKELAINTAWMIFETVGLSTLRDVINLLSIIHLSDWRVRW